VINDCLTNNKIIATKIKQNKPTNLLVEQTWEAILGCEWELLPNWMNLHEVLVGRRAHHTRIEDACMH